MVEKSNGNLYFSRDYSEARERLLAAGKSLDADIESYTNPELGSDGETLATDVLSMGNPESKSLLIVCSGTHGVEGLAGSALQLGLLESGIAEAAARELRIVLIHAINPYGFAHVRRFNEDNVDLNRNFLPKCGPYPENPGYEKLASTICPQSLSTISEVKALVRLLMFAARYGLSATRVAVTGGQYSHPDGLFFGGHAPTWSAETLRKIVARHAEGMSRIVFFDVHTGLGPFANAEIISNSPKNTDEYRRARAIWGARVKTTKAGESVSADLSGTLKLAVQGMVPSGTMTAASIEFGTVPALVALRALRDENWLHHFGDPRSEGGQRIKARLLAAFVPDDDGWRQTVWTEGIDALKQAMGWLRSKDGGTHVSN